MDVNKDRSGLKLLKAIHRELMFKELVHEKRGSTLLLDGGTILHGLKKNPKVAVVDAYGAKGSTVDTHIHYDENDQASVKEWLIVYSGKLELSVEAKHKEGRIVYVLGVGDSFLLEPGVSHSGTFLEDTHFIGVTVPAEKGFPDGGSN